MPGPDIIAVVTYTYTDCAKACASYNRNVGRTSCKGVVFNADMTSSVAGNYGTCFLKSGSTAGAGSGYNSFAGMVLL